MVCKVICFLAADQINMLNICLPLKFITDNRKVFLKNLLSRIFPQSMESLKFQTQNSYIKSVSFFDHETLRRVTKGEKLLVTYFYVTHRNNSSEKTFLTPMTRQKKNIYINNSWLTRKFTEQPKDYTNKVYDGTKCKGVWALNVLK